MIPGGNDTLVPQNYTMHWLFAVRYGLTKSCWWNEHARLSTDGDNYQLVEPMHVCTPHRMNFRDTEVGFMQRVDTAHDGG